MSRSATQVRDAPKPVTVPASRATEPRVGDRAFALLQALIYREAGIHLPNSKKELLTRRLSRRLRSLGLTSFDDYYEVVSAPEASAERIAMLDCIATNETRFFREPKQFEILEQEILPRWRRAADAGNRARRVRAWSTACSTGQEAYSLAMVLLHHLPPATGWEIEVLASDLSTRALETAAAAIWSIDEVTNIPEPLLRQFMLRGKAARLGSIKAGPELREVVQCRRINLHTTPYPSLGTFDLIFCRNVLIYFDHVSRLGVLERLIAHLAPDGYLFGGHAESLTSVTGRLHAVMPTVYRHLSAAESAGGRA